MYHFLVKLWRVLSYTYFISVAKILGLPLGTQEGTHGQELSYFPSQDQSLDLFHQDLIRFP